MVIFSFLPALAIYILFFAFYTKAFNNTNVTIYDAIPQLKELNHVSAPPKGIHSHWNGTYCCLQSIRDGISLYADSGEFFSVNQSEISLGDANITKFIKTTQEDGGFPCGGESSSWDGFAPSVIITARYYLNSCGRGWHRSSTFHGTSQWLAPFFGFIIPAIVFCLTIPRRRKLEIPNALFHARLDDLFAWAFAIPKLIVAAILVTSDTLVWLCICFAFAGPMLLSATLEAYLDNRLVYFFDTLDSQHITAQMKAIILFVVLCGNLDLNEIDDKVAANPSPIILGSEHDPIISEGTLHQPTYLPENRQSAETSAHRANDLPLETLHSRISSPGLQNSAPGSYDIRLDEESSVGSRLERSTGGETLIPSTPQDDPVQKIIHHLRDTLSAAQINNVANDSTNVVYSKLQRIEDLVKDLGIQDSNSQTPETDVLGRLGGVSNSPLDHIEHLVYPLRLYGPEGHCDIEEANGYAAEIHPCYHACQWRPENNAPSEASKSARYQRCLARVQTRLRTMLACQYSFGSTIGSPIIFFVGAFVFTLLTELVDLGDGTTALNLAFGMWWMIIPHLAIMSGLLLAGNNPNTLEGVVAHGTLPEDSPLTFYTIASGIFIHSRLISREWFESKRGDGKQKIFVSFLTHPIFNWIGIQLAYPSRYKTQWLWQRGVNKQRWIAAVTDRYLISKGKVPDEYQVRDDEFRNEDKNLSEHKKQQMDPMMLSLCKKMGLSTGDWFRIFSMSGFMLLVPFGLSFMTSFETPTIGLSCRSLTFTVYLFTQILQMAVSFYDWRASLHGSGVFWRHFRYSISILLGAISVFTAIGGTMMQLTGVFSNCICDTPLIYWFDLDNPKATFEIGTNTVQQVHQAHKFWVPGAGTAVAFLGIVCYVGWWYQRRLRNKFRLVVENLHKARTA